ncbi:hypothetical protein [Erythrobacter colymbi]|uniref:hypothetical protein n=1 Tax=Erythrobacter colymbi TaxID=1161202 RepID=UPI000A399D0B|nr:hypothetical protein [Erythrobacter colymbi]
MRVTAFGALTAAVLAAGLVLVALLGLVLLMGDCAAATDTDAALKSCIAEGRRQVFAYLVLAPVMWVAGVALALRKKPYAMLVGLLAGPISLAAVGVVF